jgi:hypothetical protein
VAVFDVVLVGLFAAGLASVIRALPYFRDLVFRGVKPWACDLCMSWWGSLAGALLLGLHVERGWATAAVVAVAGVAVSLAALRATSQPVRDFVLPPEEP